MPTGDMAVPPPDADAPALAAERAYETGDFVAARQHYTNLLDACLRHYGPADLATARAQRGLGATLLEQGSYAAGQALLEQALATRTQLLGSEHPDTVQTLNDLAAAYFCRNDPATAIRLTTQALALRERILGSDHPDTIESLNNLGIMEYRQGLRDEAMARHTEALARCERSLGAHRRTVETLNALAVKLAREQAGYPQARALYEQALAMSEQVLGTNHPLTAQLLNNLAAVLADLREGIAARILLQRSLILHEQVFGTDHPKTAWVLVNLGDLDQTDRDFVAARERFTDALIIREAALGAQHPDTVKVLRKLVAALGNLGRDDPRAMQEAMPLHQCLMALEAAAGTLAPENRFMPGAALDPAHAASNLHTLVERLAEERRRPPPTPDTLAVIARAEALERQADSLVQAGDYAAAQDLLEQALALREEAQGHDHMDLVPPLRALEQVLRQRRLNSKILPIRQRIVDIHMRALGAGHTLTMNALSDLMTLISYEYGLEESFPLQDQVAQMMKDALGPDDPHVKMILGSIARMREHLKTKAAAQPDQPRISRSEKREAALAAPELSVADLFAGIEKVPWQTLQHAYGSAEDVPDLLRLLLSDDLDVRDDAYEQLFGNIWHQGTVYQASAYAVPFLLRMLADPHTPERHGVLNLLEALATGNSYLAVHHREDDDKLNWRTLLAKQGEDFDARLQEELSWVRAANLAVAEGLDLLLRLLSDPAEDTELRLLTITTVAMLPTRAAESTPQLKALLDTETDGRLRTSLLHALHILLDDAAEAQQFFTDLLASQEVAAIRLIAAVALLTRARDHAPAAAIQIALDALSELGAWRHQYDAPPEEQEAWQAVEQRFCPGWGASALVFILRGLQALDERRSGQALLQALRSQHDPEDAEQVAMALLDLAFPGSKPTYRGRSYSRDKATGMPKINYWGGSKVQPRQAHALSQTQRMVLVALAEHDTLWEQQSNLLDLYGWPTERAALRALLREAV